MLVIWIEDELALLRYIEPLVELVEHVTGFISLEDGLLTSLFLGSIANY